MSIGYASRPRLRSRLPQGRSALPWKPWIFGREDSHLSLATHSGILSSIHSVLGHALPTACSVYPPASPLHSNDFRWYRNLNLLSIAYSFRSRLRSRLTLSGRTFLRKPQIFGGQDSHLPLATHANILSPIQSTETHISASARIRCSSTIPYGYPKLRW